MRERRTGSGNWRLSSQQAVAHDQHELVQQAGRQALLTPGQSMAAHHPEVELVGADPLLDHARVRDPEVHRDARVPLAKASDDPGEHVDAGRRARADQQGAALQALELSDDLPRAVERREDPVGVVEQ